MNIFRDLFSALNKRKVRYLIIGGVAVNLYGVERATGDIDIVIDMDQGNIKKFVSVAHALGFKPKVPVRLEDIIEKEKRDIWVEQKGMMVFSLVDPKNPFFILDVMLNVPFVFSKVYEKREILRFGTITIPVVPITTLIAMKEKTMRPQDEADVLHLKKIRKEWAHEK